MQKTNKNSKRLSGKNLTKSLSARISPMPSPHKYPSICFDIDYLKTSKNMKSPNLKFKATSSTIVSPKYFSPDQSSIIPFPKRGNKSVPDSIQLKKNELTQAIVYTRHLKERLEAVRKENIILESLTRTKSSKKSKAWKIAERFKKKLSQRLNKLH